MNPADLSNHTAAPLLYPKLLFSITYSLYILIIASTPSAPPGPTLTPLLPLLLLREGEEPPWGIPHARSLSSCPCHPCSTTSLSAGTAQDGLGQTQHWATSPTAGHVPLHSMYPHAQRDECQSTRKVTHVEGWELCWHKPAVCLLASVASAIVHQVSLRPALSKASTLLSLAEPSVPQSGRRRPLRASVSKVCTAPRGSFRLKPLRTMPSWLTDVAKETQTH